MLCEFRVNGTRTRAYASEEGGGVSLYEKRTIGALPVSPWNHMASPPPPDLGHFDSAQDALTEYPDVDSSRATAHAVLWSAFACLVLAVVGLICYLESRRSRSLAVLHAAEAVAAARIDAGEHAPLPRAMTKAARAHCAPARLRSKVARGGCNADRQPLVDAQELGSCDCGPSPSEGEGARGLAVSLQTKPPRAAAEPQFTRDARPQRQQVRAAAQRGSAQLLPTPDARNGARKLTEAEVAAGDSEGMSDWSDEDDEAIEDGNYRGTERVGAATQQDSANGGGQIENLALQAWHAQREHERALKALAAERPDAMVEAYLNGLVGCGTQPDAEESLETEQGAAKESRDGSSDDTRSDMSDGGVEPRRQTLSQLDRAMTRSMRELD